MTTAPADLIETLARLDGELGVTVRDALSADLVRGMTDGEVLDLTRVAEALGRRIDAVRVVTAAEVDERSRTELGEERLSARSGCTGAADLICRTTGVAAATARARIRQGRAVAVRTTLTGDPLPARFPTVREAIIDGTIGIDGIGAITTVLSPIADRCDPAQWAAAEYELTAAAAGTGSDGAPACTADDTRLQAKVWELVLDPDGALPDHERAARKRGLRFGPDRDGIRAVNGFILAELYEQFTLLADAHLNPRVKDVPDATAGVSFRESPHGAGDEPKDTRTHPQKLHDLFASILNVAARSAETPALGGAAPAVVVTIDVDDLDMARHHDDHDVGDRTGDRGRDDGVGFINGTDCTVPAFVARHAACNAGTQLLIAAGDGRIVALGSPNRTFTSQQRKAIIARDGECVIPGCHTPASWCEFHHVIPHAEGGSTHVDNGVPLCWWHHRTIETSGWQIRMVNGLPEVRAPRNIDPTRQWRRASGSLHRARNRLRKRVNSRTRASAAGQVRRT